jgi:hypothetical protein
MTQTASPVYLSCADTAKLVRKALKREFPTTKFSVRSSTYSGGASISVKWLDGPTAEQAKAVAGAYAGATFDGMIDLKSYHTSELTYLDAPELDGQAVHFGADFVFVDRALSEEFAGEIRDRLVAEHPTFEWPPVRKSYPGYSLDWEHENSDASPIGNTQGMWWDDSCHLFGRLAQETAR